MSDNLGIAFSLLCIDTAHRSFEGRVSAEEIHLKAESIAEIYMYAAAKVKDGNDIGLYHINVGD